MTHPDRPMTLPTPPAQDPAAKCARPGYLQIALGLAFTALVLLALYARIMGYDLRRDELMFVPPAALLGEHGLYTGFFYNHVPYSAWLMRAVHLALPFMGLLAAARLTIFLTWLALLGVAAWLGWRMTGRLGVAAFCAISLLASETLLSQTGMAATNNLLPLPFALAGLGLFTLALAERRLFFWTLFAAGLLLSVAAGMKASAIAFVPAVALASFLLPREMTFSERAMDLALPVALGGLAGALPLILLALTEPTFFAHILGYHSGPHIAFWRDNAASEPGLAIGLAGKVQLAQTVWLSGAPLLAGFALLVGLSLMLRRDRSGRRRGWQDATDGIVVTLAATGTAAALAFVPTPGFPQYYATPLIGLPLMVALVMRALTAEDRRIMTRIFTLGAVVMLVIAAPRLGLGLNGLRHPGKLTPAQISAGGAALAQALADHGAPKGPVATFAPLYPLEAGLPVYPEFGTGAFAYRVAPYTAPDLRAHYVMPGPDTLDALFAARPPAALLTGFDGTLDDDLTTWAKAHGYVPEPLPEAHDRYGTGTLWLPSTSSALPKGDAS